MSCAVCNKPASTQSVVGLLCAEHWANDAPLRAAYFAYVAAGGEPHLFAASDERKQAIAGMKADESK